AVCEHAMKSKPNVRSVVNGYPPEQRLQPANLGIYRKRRQLQHVRHAELRDEDFTIRLAAEGHGNAPVAFLHLDPTAQDVANAVGSRAVHETEMAMIERVIDILEVIAAAFVRVDLQQTVELRKFGIERKFRRLAFAQKGEYQAQIFSNRIALDANLVGETRFLRWLLDATAVTVVFPAMIETADRISLHES